MSADTKNSVMPVLAAIVTPFAAGIHSLPKGLGLALLITIAVPLCWSAGLESRSIPFNSQRLIDLEDCDVMRIFARVWKFTPLVEEEKAVWIIFDSPGKYHHIDWLRTPQRNISVWMDELPKNIVAQAHTHGDRMDPKPSEQDLSVARKLNIPVYTLARKGIWKASPNGSVTKEADRGWFDRTQKKCEED